MIQHFEEHRGAPSPPSNKGTKSSTTISLRVSSPVVEVNTMMMYAKTFEKANLQTAMKEKDQQILAIDGQIARVMEKLEILTANMGDVSQAAERNLVTRSMNPIVTNTFVEHAELLEEDQPTA